MLAKETQESFAERLNRLRATSIYLLVKMTSDIDYGQVLYFRDLFGIKHSHYTLSLAMREMSTRGKLFVPFYARSSHGFSDQVGYKCATLRETIATLRERVSRRMAGAKRDHLTCEAIISNNRLSVSARSSLLKIKSSNRRIILSNTGGRHG